MNTCLFFVLDKEIPFLMNYETWVIMVYSQKTCHNVTEHSRNRPGGSSIGPIAPCSVASWHVYRDNLSVSVPMLCPSNGYAQLTTWLQRYHIMGGITHLISPANALYTAFKAKTASDVNLWWPQDSHGNTTLWHQYSHFLWFSNMTITAIQMKDCILNRIIACLNKWSNSYMVAMWQITAKLFLKCQCDRDVVLT